VVRFQHEEEDRRPAHRARGHAGSRTRRAGQRLSWIRDWPAALAAMVGAMTFLGLTDFGRDTRGPISMTQQIQELAVGAGFGLDAVSVAGHKFTLLDDVFAAIDLDHVRVVWPSELVAIKARLEQLPWIAEAKVTRSGLNGVDVLLVERKPAAVWGADSAPGTPNWLLDANGRRLGPILATAHTDLLRISGRAGDERLRDLIALLDVNPELKSKVVHSTLRAGRRWSLTLTTGHILHLPSEGAAAALSGASHIINGMIVGDGNVVQQREIDLSVPGRVAVRPVAVAPKEPVSPPQSSNGS
jgi:cell division protein FtsQ